MAMLLLQAGAAQPTAAPVTVPARIGVSVSPETVTVGERVTVIVRVRAPAGSTIEFPAGTDSAATVDLAADVAVAEPRLLPVASGPPVEMEQTAGYRMAAWDIEEQPLGLGEIIVRSGVVERRIPLAAYT